MPDCQHLLDKDLITAPPPDQGPVLTVFSPRSFRYFVEVFDFILFQIPELTNPQDHYEDSLPYPAHTEPG